MRCGAARNQAPIQDAKIPTQERRRATKADIPIVSISKSMIVSSESARDLKQLQGPLPAKGLPLNPKATNEFQDVQQLQIYSCGAIGANYQHRLHPQFLHQR